MGIDFRLAEHSQGQNMTLGQANRLEAQRFILRIISVGKYQTEPAVHLGELLVTNKHTNIVTQGTYSFQMIQQTKKTRGLLSDPVIQPSANTGGIGAAR